MKDISRIQKEYETAVNKKRALSERLREAEKTDPADFNQIWIIRDQIAYWEGRSEGIKFVIDELNK